jgi:hypothetical protein
LIARTGIDWFAYGDKACDGYTRQFITRKCDGVHGQSRRLWPIWDWRDTHVKSYLRARRYPLPARLGYPGRGGSGLSLDAAELMWLKEHYPDDYAKICEYFPFAPIQIERLKRGDFDKIPGVRDAKNAALEADGGHIQPSKDRLSQQEEAAIQLEEGWPVGADHSQ